MQNLCEPFALLYSINVKPCNFLEKETCSHIKNFPKNSAAEKVLVADFLNRLSTFVPRFQVSVTDLSLMLHFDIIIMCLFCTDSTGNAQPDWDQTNSQKCGDIWFAQPIGGFFHNLKIEPANRKKGFDLEGRLLGASRFQNKFCIRAIFGFCCLELCKFRKVKSKNIFLNISRLTS